MTFDKISAIFSAFNPQLEILSSERLYSGLSNDNFLVHTEQHAYLLKCYRDHWPSVGLAAQTQLAAQQICPTPIWLDKNNQRAIFNYIDGDIAQGHYCSELISKLVKLHQHAVTTPPMDIKYELDYYRETALYQTYKQAVASSLCYISNQPRDPGFCHNDLVKENIIANSTGMYLIDFEYAKSNDIYFDLAALAVSFVLTTEQKKQLLRTYQNCLPKVHLFNPSLEKLEHYQVVFLVLCVCWYHERGITDKVVMLCKQLDYLIK
ncbi:phosphotransferase [Pseudoalteromonas shioyasakiensis]|uniref:phosphotransferase n=1 Tax=Pseudoalteromonas shioyasakiensis TaxID=1190813 RepID=UPI00211915B0|nr:phosphotransferase [Pseudoalteromonas shioyasakiensis]MCQ8878950.1 phosphotransferase [Pseudoalteromonas shioyasakiensis]